MDALWVKTASSPRGYFRRVVVLLAVVFRLLPVVLRAPALALVDFDAVEREIVFLAPVLAFVVLRAPVLALVDFDAVEREVVFLAPAFVVVLRAPVLALVDFDAVEREVVFFAPALAFVVFLAPVLALVDLEAVERVVVFLAPLLALVDLAAPARVFVERVELFEPLRDADALPFDVDRVAISIGSCAYSGGYR